MANYGARYPEPMRVQMLYFGVLREHMGTPGEELELGDGTSVSGLLRVLQSQTSKSGMDAFWERLAVAVNREYVAAGHVLRDGDEVALLPPVSGGRR